MPCTLADARAIIKHQPPTQLLVVVPCTLPQARLHAAHENYACVPSICPCQGVPASMVHSLGNPRCQKCLLYLHLVLSGVEQTHVIGVSTLSTLWSRMRRNTAPGNLKLVPRCASSWQMLTHVFRLRQLQCCYQSYPAAIAASRTQVSMCCPKQHSPCCCRNGLASFAVQDHACCCDPVLCTGTAVAQQGPATMAAVAQNLL